MQSFSYSGFIALYPQFATAFTQAQTEDIYTYEALIVGSKVLACFKDLVARYKWSLRVLAHILTKYQLGLTGRVSQSSEGSVSGSFENLSTDSAAYWDTTVFGQSCWQVLKNRGGATLVGTLRCWNGNPYSI